jgi:NADPH-dependent 2,4-dienoyl-CoA reductase/sulfur reductase-like enzyme
MQKQSYKYIIVGAGIAGLSAVEGIREHDKSGPILLIGDEKYPPYNRTPLTKELWWGTIKAEELFIHDNKYFEQNDVDLLFGKTVVSLDAKAKTVTDDTNVTVRYEKLLLATGGRPRTLPIPGGNLEGICYYRYLDDYYGLSGSVSNRTSVLIIGGGFIGSELGASLSENSTNVTMLYPENYVCSMVLPEYLGKNLEEMYLKHGVTLISKDKPVAFEKSGNKFITTTQKGREIQTDAVVAGIGIAASSALAESAGIRTGRNIIVNEYQQTSQPDIYAAGDNTEFPYLALGRTMHVDHWDHALNHGKWAGRNMAGARTPYDYIPKFFSTIYDLNYEAVGEVIPELKNIARWKEQSNKGVIYFIRGDRIVGVLTCNLHSEIDRARELVRQGNIPPELVSAVR